MVTRQQARFLEEQQRALQQLNMSDTDEDSVPQEPPVEPPQQANQINELIAALINAANAANPNPIRNRDPGEPAPFALLPGKIRAGPLDYNNPTDMKLFNKAIRGIDPKFDLKEGNLSTFLMKLKEHARIFGWDTIMNVPDASGTERNLATNYGQITLEDVKRHARTYISTDTRAAQDSIMLYQFLTNSLTEDANTSVLSNSATYTIATLPSGACLLKILIGKASIDTKAKVLLLREVISNLHIKIGEFSGDVRKFNIFVNNTKDELAGRGQKVDELVTHLFKAYEQINDDQFRSYILNKRDKYDDGEEITADELMGLAQNKFDLIRHRAETDAITVREPNDKILALEAEIVALKAVAAKGKSGNGNKDRYAWKKVKPKTGEPASKMVKGKKYHWCRFHQAWTIHAEKECTLGNENNEQSGESNEKVKSENSKRPKDSLVLAKSYCAVLESDDES
jgi:hypothetical protein